MSGPWYHGRPVPVYTPGQRLFGWGVLGRVGLGHRHKLLWELILRHDKPDADEVGGCWLSQRTMAVHLGPLWHERTVRRVLGEMQKFSLIARVGRTSDVRWFAVIPDYVLKWCPGKGSKASAYETAAVAAAQMLTAALPTLGHVSGRKYRTRTPAKKGPVGRKLRTTGARTPDNHSTHSGHEPVLSAKPEVPAVPQVPETHLASESFTKSYLESSTGSLDREPSRSDERDVCSTARTNSSRPGTESRPASSTTAHHPAEPASEDGGEFAIWYEFQAARTCRYGTVLPWDDREQKHAFLALWRVHGFRRADFLPLVSQDLRATALLARTAARSTPPQEEDRPI